MGGATIQEEGRRHVSLSCVCFREELPTIYKCPHQGCTAVYRGADGMKVRQTDGQGKASPAHSGFPFRLVCVTSLSREQKHIKEHHEEVRERPCPHPGCNKVFMIDRYLQRHVKLIHTGEGPGDGATRRARGPQAAICSF